MITLDNIITIHPVKMHIYSFVFNNNKIKFFVQKSYIPRKIKELKFIIIYTLWPNYKYLQSFKKLCAANLEKLLWPTNKNKPSSDGWTDCWKSQKHYTLPATCTILYLWRTVTFILTANTIISFLTRSTSTVDTKWTYACLLCKQQCAFRQMIYQSWLFLPHCKSSLKSLIF